MDFMVISGKKLENDIHTILRGVVRPHIAEQVTQDIMGLLQTKTIDTGDISDLMLTKEEIDTIARKSGDVLMGDLTFDEHVGWINYDPTRYSEPGHAIIDYLNKAQLRKFKEGYI